MPIFKGLLTVKKTTAGYRIFLNNIISVIQTYLQISDPTDAQKVSIFTLIANWIETDPENAKDESGNSIFQGYLNTYDES